MVLSKWSIYSELTIVSSIDGFKPGSNCPIFSSDSAVSLIFPVGRWSQVVSPYLQSDFVGVAIKSVSDFFNVNGNQFNTFSRPMTESAKARNQAV